MKNTVKFLLSIVGFVAVCAPAHATKYNCATAEEVPNVYYEFDNDGDNPPSSGLALYRMADTKANAAEFLKSRIDHEGPAPKGSVITVKSYASNEFKGGPHGFWIKVGTKDLLDIPYIDPLQGRIATVEMDGMVFAGVEVKKVTYTFCGKD